MNPSIPAHILCIILLSAFVVRLSVARASHVDTSALLAGILLLIWAVVIVWAERQQNYVVVPVSPTDFRSDLPPFDEWTWQHRLVARVAYDFFAAGWTILLLRRLKRVRRRWAEVQVAQRAGGAVHGRGAGSGPSARSLAAWLGVLMAFLTLFDSATSSIGTLILLGGHVSLCTTPRTKSLTISATFGLVIAMVDLRLWLRSRSSSSSSSSSTVSVASASASGSDTGSGSSAGAAKGISITISHAYPPSPLGTEDPGAWSSIIIVDLIASLAFLSLVGDTASGGRVFLDVQHAVDAAFVLGLSALLAAPLVDGSSASHRAGPHIRVSGPGLICPDDLPSAGSSLSPMSSIAEEGSEAGGGAGDRAPGRSLPQQPL